MVLLAAGTLTLASMNITMVMAEDTESGTEISTEEAAAGDTEGVAMEVEGNADTAVFAEDGTPVTKTVKAYELNFPSQDLYDFPYMGLQFSLPDELKKQMENSDVLMMTAEDWTSDMSGIKYAFVHWNKLTEEQKNEDVDMLGTGYEDWLKSIERIGTLGMYSTDVVDDLDNLTGCNEQIQI